MKARTAAIVSLLALCGMLLAFVFGSGPLGRWLTIALRQPNNRSNHMAVTLSSGEVVLIDGVSKRSSVGYDPGTGRWRTIGPSKLPAAGQVTALLADGRVLVCGGFEAGGVIGAGVTALDPASGNWHDLAPLQDRRAFHSATTLPDRRVLVVGGRARDGATALSPDNNLHPSNSPLVETSTEFYDAQADRWSLGPPLQVGREQHSATLLADGQVLVVGGKGSGPNKVGTAERFDPRLGIWVNAGALFTPRAAHTATRLSDGRVLIVGGVGPSDRAITAVERYNPQNDTWQIIAPLRQARVDHAAVLLPDGEVLIIGGSGTLGNTPTSATFAGTERYDPVTASWRAAAPLATARRDFTASLLPDGRVLVAGGIDARASGLSSTEIYDPIADRWEKGTPMTRPRFP